MARDTLTIGDGVVEHLRRAGIDVPPFARVLRSWERTTPLRGRAARS